MDLFAISGLVNGLTATAVGAYLFPGDTVIGDTRLMDCSV